MNIDCRQLKSCTAMRACGVCLRIRTTPHQDNSHCTGIGPDEWFYAVVVVLVGSCPSGE